MTQFLKSIDPELFDKIRVIERGDELFFVGKDVCDALGYKRANDVMKNLPRECKCTEKVDNYNMTLISEPALYFVLQQTRKKTALKFQWWLANTALHTRINNGIFILP